jgi:hypothetical protein
MFRVQVVLLVLAVMDVVAKSFKNVCGRGRSAMAEGDWDGMAAAAGMGQQSAAGDRIKRCIIRLALEAVLDAAITSGGDCDGDSDF